MDTARLMIPELGQLALALAFVLALVQGILPLAGAARGNAAWMSVGRRRRTSRPSRSRASREYRFPPERSKTGMPRARISSASSSRGPM